MSEEPTAKRAKMEQSKNTNNRAEIWKQKKVVVVGISGKVGSGKSCAADAIKDKFPNTIVRNFADRLKEEVALHLGIDVSLCYSHDGKNMFIPEYGMTIGEILQKWGTMLRELHQDIWILAVQSYIDVLISQKNNDDEQLIVCIGDCRFENECTWIRSVGGIVVRLEGDPGKERARSKRDLNHISETALDSYKEFDVVINTDETNRVDTASNILQCISIKR